MESTYDENLSENIFLRSLETNYSEIFKKTVDNNWIICVPRTGSFKNNYIVTETDVSGHVLMPQSQDDDFDHQQTFKTITGNKILLINRHLSFKDHEFNNKTSRLLFEETFYTDNLLKYTVWCIERPLTPGSLDLDNDVVVLSNVGDCMNFLWTEVDDKNLFRDLDYLIESFENLHKNNFYKNSIEAQRQLIEKLYHECLDKIINTTKLHEKITSPHYCRTIKLAVESYVLYGLRNLLPGAVSTTTSQDDAKLNKIIKNLYKLELKDLTDIRHDIQSGIARGKIELSRLDTFVTVLGKVGCLKRAVHNISENYTISSDDLLPILIYIVVRTGLPNWIAQLEFMKQLRFSADASNESDEVGFLITTLEAAVEHIRSGELSVENQKISLVKSLDDTPSSSQDKSTAATVNEFFTAVQKCDLDKIEIILNQKKQKPTLESKLCHPLCRCEKCESSFTEIQLAQSSRPSINSKDDSGRTALHIASLCGHVAVVDFLLIHHADPNDVDAEGVTPLHCAAMRGHQNTVLLLLHANADPRIPDNRGNSPLHLATDSGHEGCVKALLYFSEQMGVSINTSCTNNVGDTPLHYASKWGYMTIVEILLEHGAKKRVANRRGQTPLTIAHNSHILRRLEEHPDTVETVRRVRNRRSHQQSHELKSKIIHNKNTSVCEEAPDKIQKVDKLLAAICSGDIRLACYYLGLEGPPVKPADENPRLCHPLCVCEKCAPLEEAADQDNRTIALGLNVSNARGETALHYASAIGLVELVQILLDAGANVNSRTTNKNRTPLHIACLYSQIQVVKLLLNCCTIDINVSDYTGDTPLHLAAKNGDSNIAELLLRHGADINCRNFKGATALDEVQDVFCMKILTSHSAIDKTSCHIDDIL
ncbi:ankyrin repeat domain-containing protein 27 [Microplitis demolitor]|uniref:ankyrin repeat domain-containing protein 27 n=1 Tax=Microplitis demolitor TaxID=69319 RepID=UPI0004400265|nr:ankyrin repeat domain-containing protein 27 [Microplitis demolitor]XP_014299403.1 ankyrin repeat domain-containing protein 27 [Microplitis demolitor]XP_053596478.1 ankyrin repeat domain-containing protein 27 [Microplitis demolitor]